eukprot:GILK01013722.1.p1 GENE.GILK01013722.1~~GILK01013722.1.p1  ORF type:complete len:302 (+),score=20.00 GILK01013722.1:50-907(+)
MSKKIDIFGDIHFLLSFLRSNMPRSIKVYHEIVMARSTQIPYGEVFVDAVESPSYVVCRKVTADGRRHAFTCFVEDPNVLPRMFEDPHVFTWDRPMMMTGFYESWAPSLINACANHQFVESWLEPCHVWYLADTLPTLPTKPSQEGVTLGPLTVDVASEVNRHWKYADTYSLDTIRRYIQHHPTCGVFIEGHLAAWALCQQDGAIGMVHTKEQYRRRGLAKLAVLSLCRDIVKLGIQPWAMIVQSNTASQKLFEELNFLKFDSFHYCQYAPSNGSATASGGGCSS